MDTEPVSVGSASEIHRYFPEWADRPAGPDAQRESDRNSYLAGGYADEFGYGADAGLPPPISPLTGDPEQSRWWREQIGALHPGYPQCPKPRDRDLPQTARAVVAVRPGGGPRRVVGFRVIQVGSRERTAVGHAALRLRVISFFVERLIRHRHLNEVL